MGDPTTIATRDLLKTLLAEVEETDPEMLPPPDKPEKGAKILGTMKDEYVRRVFSLSAFYRRESMRLQIDLQASGIEPRSHDEFNKLKQKHETLQEIFWLLLRSQMNLWGTGIGIRKDWVVVNTDTVAESPGEQIIRKLFGE